MNTDRPWMTALEMQFAALRMGDMVLDSTDQRLVKHQKMYGMAQQPLRRADAFAWSPEPYTAVALAAKTIPQDATITPGLLPSKQSWWWFGDSPYFSDFGGTPIPLAALLVIEGVTDLGGSSIGFLTFGRDIDSYRLEKHGRAMIVPCSYWTWRYSETYAEMMARQEAIRTDRDPQTIVHARHLSRFFIAACTWLQQRIMVFSSGPIERHRRKQLAREHNAPIPSDVKVIQLRRSESQSRPPSAPDGEHIDWSCRWIVNGHWRNQPYKDERKLIYIMPYVKGPDDKPLKVPTHTVYQVSR